MKRISTEVRVGLIALVTIVVFIWLFSFLKGENLFSSTDRYTIIFDNIAGLEESSPVEINGFKAGIVHSVKLLNDGSGQIAVQISILKDFKLPVESVAEITTASLIAGMKIKMIIADNSQYFKNSDTIPGRVAISILDKVETGFDPVMVKIDSLLTGLEKTVSSINLVLSPEFIDDLKSTGNRSAAISDKIENIVSETESSLPELIASMNSFALMLKNNSGKMGNAIENLSIISDSLASSDIASTITILKKNLEETSKLLAGLNEGDGSAGLLLKDDSLYFNLSNSLKSLDELLTDLRENPGNYVKFSLFGGNKK